MQNNWIKDAILDIISSDLEEKLAYSDEPIEKKSTAATLLPGVLLGTLAGGLVAKKDIDQKYKQDVGNAVQRALNEKNKKFSDMGSDYYTQVRNIVADLKVMFTPINVIYNIRGTTIDTIDIHEMNDTMREKHKSRDAEYFKNYLLNRMLLEAQLAEQMFTKRLLENNDSLLRHIKKESAENEREDEGAETVVYNPFVLQQGLSKMAAMFRASAASEAIDKYAFLLISHEDNWEPAEFNVSLDDIRPLKEVGLDLGEKLAFFGLFERNDTKFLKPGYLLDNVKVSFLPDRVVFVVDNTVISQISTFEMNEDGFDKFKAKDVNFFRRLFSRHVSDPLEKLNLHVESELPAPIVKEAAGDPGLIARELFTKNDIHPKVYNLIMEKTFGTDWITWDSEVILKNIEDAFGVPEVSNTAMDKVLSIKVVRTSAAPFTGYHAFEKVVRAFNNKSVDFSMSQPNLSLGEILFAIRVMGNLIEDADHNVYDNFSEEVYEYIKDILGDNDYRSITIRANGATESGFFRLLNIDLLDYWNKAYTQNVGDKSTADSFRRINKLVQDVSTKLISSVSKDQIDESEIARLARQELEVYNIRDNTTVENLVVNNTVYNVAAEYYQKHMATLLVEQIKHYVEVD